MENKTRAAVLKKLGITQAPAAKPDSSAAEAMEQKRRRNIEEMKKGVGAAGK